MDERLKLEIATIEIWHIVAIVISIIAFMTLFMKAKRTESLKAFFYVQFTMILWMVAKVLKTVSPTVEIRWSFIVLQYFAICLLEVAFLEFGYAYYKEKSIPKKIKLFLYICPIIQFAIMATNPLHHLFYSKYNFRRDSFGIAFYFHYLIEYIYIVIGGVFCGIKFNRQFSKENRVFMYIVSVGILAPIVLNLIYVSKVLHRFFKFIKLPVVFDITPIVFTWSLLLFVYATLKNEMFNLSPIMRHEIIYKLDTPVCIVDSAKDILFANEQLIRNLEIDDLQKLRNALEANSELIFSYDSNKDIANIVEYNGRYFKVHSRIIRNLSGSQHVITFNDITSYVLVQNKLTEKNDELLGMNKKLEAQIEMLKQTSRIGARNFVARELHDIIGHSLVVTIKLLEVVKIFYIKDKVMAIEAIEKAKYSIDTGFSEMKELSSKKLSERIYNGILLERELSKMLKGVEAAGNKTNFYFRGTINEMDEKVFDVVKKVCTELFTNTLKHGEATKILLALNFKMESLYIYYMDDGVGTDKIIKGNGLTGIDSRLELVGGWAKHHSSANEGFNSRITIPCIK